MKSSKKTPILDFVAERLLKSYNAPPSYEAKPNMRPSFLGTPCLRKIYYNFLRVKPDYGWELEAIKNFQKGDAFHGIVKTWLEGANLMIPYRNKKGEIPKHWKTGEPDPEFPVNDPDLGIKNAKIDAVGILKDVPGIEDGLWVFEIKSINKKGFDNYILKGPKDEHKEQAMIYAFLLEQGLRAGEYAHIPELDGWTDVKGVLFIYLNRESDIDDWKEFVVPKNDEIFVNTVEKIIQTKDYISEDKLPPKTEDFCKWCSYREKCKADFKLST